MFFRVSLFLFLMNVSLSVHAQMEMVDQKIYDGPEIEFIKVDFFKYVDLNSVVYEGTFHDKSFNLKISDQKKKTPLTFKLGRLHWYLPREAEILYTQPDLNTIVLTKTVSEDISIDHLIIEYQYGQSADDCEPLIFGGSRGKAFINILLSGSIEIETYEFNKQCHILERTYKGDMK